MIYEKEEIRVKGKTFMVDSLQIDNKRVILTGKLIEMASIKDEWFQLEDIQEPELFIEKLKKNKHMPDIFTFIQRLPETNPKYNYYMEWESIAALFVKSFDHWWEKQISTHVRKTIRRAEKKGIVIKLVDFDDKFVEGIKSIYNEAPIRQGKPFWHYGKNFDTIKKEAATYLERSDFIGAYYNDELIGFIKIVYRNKCANMMHIISKIKHRDKGATNLLLANTVKICDRKQISYLTYGEWSKGTLGNFKRHNGFIKIECPRYYIPLSVKGKLYLKCKLHLGIKEIIPEKIILFLINLRREWYKRKYKVFY